MFLPTGEGAPQGLRGWGVRWMGAGEGFPSGFGQSPRFGALPRKNVARQSRQASQTPIDFEALASK
ncbi:hypothetical protein COI61_05940 [Bacillus cereus]|nr:hypothetical protein COI61_05940 [Bacillus cereus]